MQMMKIQGLFKAFECLTSTFQDKFYFQDFQDSHVYSSTFSACANPVGGPMGRNFVLNGIQGEVRVPLKIKLFKGDSFSFCHHTNTTCGSNLLQLHHISPSI